MTWEKGLWAVGVFLLGLAIIRGLIEILHRQKNRRLSQLSARAQTQKRRQSNRWRETETRPAPVRPEPSFEWLGERKDS